MSAEQSHSLRPGVCISENHTLQCYLSGGSLDLPTVHPTLSHEQPFRSGTKVSASLTPSLGLLGGVGTTQAALGLKES